MGEQRNEGLAPVTYLPWAVPSSEGSGDGGSASRGERVAAAAGVSGRHPAGRGRAVREHPADDRADTGEAEGGRGVRGRLAIVGEEPEAETGVERDERIDRLIVSRLRRSSLSVAEVRATLAEHGLDDHEIEEWVERYERLGYLDDRRLAEQLVHSHGVRRGRGSGALLHELGRRGIDGELARSALEALDPEVELEHATAIAARRVRQLAGLDRAVAHRRLTAFLLRRGYGGDVVREAVRAALDDDAE
ncbi:regulatory protein RecX [Agromyces sp. ZXT2-6]|uniref:regulatory protein RecX n=1 Tax=Agromyces sp. ZXT2-6 TaxID=3461153 RepID=UPI004054BC3C